MVELEGLQFEIQGSSEEASKSIDKFIKTLERLKRVSASGTSGLDKTADSLKRLNRALSAFDNKKLTRVTNALERIGNVKGVTLSATLSKRLDDLAASIKHITHDDISKLNDLTEALRDLGSVGDVKIPNIKQKKEKKRAEETEIPESTGKSITDLAVVMQSLAKATQRAIVPLTQLASMGMSIYEAFEEMYEGTWRYINIAGKLDSGVTKAIVPLTQLASTGMDVYEVMDDMVEGTWRYIKVAGELGNGASQAIVPFQQMSIALEETKTKAIDFGNIIEGAWSNVSDGSQVTSEFGTSANRLKDIFGAVKDKVSQFSESMRNSLEGLSDTFANIAGAIQPVITAIHYLIRIIGALISRAFDAFKRLAGVIWNLLTPLRQLIREFMKLPAIGLKNIGKMLISPFTNLIKTIKNLRKTFDNLFASITRIAVYRLIRSAIKELSQGFKEGIDNLYQYSKLMGGEFAKSLDSLTTNLLYLKNSLGAMVSPIINALAPAFDVLTEKVVGVINAVNQLISRLTGKSTYMAAKKLVKQYQEIKNATIGIDELNIIGDDVDDYANMFEELPISDDIKSFADKLKAAFESGDWEGLGKLLGQKVNEAIDKIPWDEIGEKIGYFLNGAIQTAYYFLDTVDFANLGSHLADLINKVINGIDFEIFGRLFIKKMTVIWDFVIGFLTTLDWGLVAKSLSDFVIGVFSEFIDWFTKWDWAELGQIFTNKVKNFFDNLDVVEIGRKAGEFLKTVFKSFKTWLDNVDWVQVGKDLINAITDFFKEFDFEGVVKEFFSFLGSAAKAIKDLLKPFWDGIVAWWNEHIKGENFIKSLNNLSKYLLKFVNDNILNPFMKAFTGKEVKEDENFFNKFKELGKHIVEGIFEGIKDWAIKKSYESIVNSFYTPFIKQFCDIFGIHSPAESMFPIGENIILGVFGGIVESMKDIGGWVKMNIFDPFIGGMSESYEDVKGIASTVWGWVDEGFKSITDKVKGVGQTVVGWFKDGTDNGEAEIVAKETGNNIVDNIEQGAEDKIPDFDTFGQKIADCIYNSLSVAQQDNQLSLLQQLAGNIVSTLIQSMSDALTEDWENYNMDAVLGDFATAFTDEIYASLAIANDENQISLIDDLSANIVNSLIKGMRTSLTEKLDSYDISGQLKDFATSFIEKIYESLTITDNEGEMSLLNSLAASIVSDIVDGMTVENPDIQKSFGKFANAFTNAIYDSLEKIGIGDSMSPLQKLAERIATTLIHYIKDKFNSAMVNMEQEFEGRLQAMLDKADSYIKDIKAELDSIETDITVTIHEVHVVETVAAHAMGGIIPHAVGGIFVKPTTLNIQGTDHLFGEAGREAVLPLDSYTGWMDEIAEKVDDRVGDGKDGFTLEQALANFYQGYLEPVMSEISADTKRQADKNERTVVKIGNREIRDAYNSQTKIDGYSFTRG